jgi:DNA polymerase III delta subunit
VEIQGVRLIRLIGSLDATVYTRMKTSNLRANGSTYTHINIYMYMYMHMNIKTNDEDNLWELESRVLTIINHYRNQLR